MDPKDHKDAIMWKGKIFGQSQPTNQTEGFKVPIQKIEKLNYT